MVSLAWDKGFDASVFSSAGKYEASRGGERFGRGLVLIIISARPPARLKSFRERRNVIDKNPGNTNTRE